MIEAASSSSTSVGRSSDKKNGEANVDLHPKFRMEENLEAEKDDCNPMIHMMYEFYFDPYSSKWAFLWTFFSCWLVIGRILEIGFQSIDGPNQYSDRKDRSLYYFMPTREEYWYIYIAFMVPLIFDALGKAITILFVVAADENKFLYRKFTGDKLEQFMFSCDQLGNIPFVINALYVYPHNTSLSQAESVVLTLLELLITGRILRMIKEIPSIKAVRVALVNSIDHLVLPVFFFVVFNITAGVFLYFAEPCYNLDDCAWEDLFQSTYFSIVTMTTTGYGNQIPRYEMGRFVACLIMLFGALFLSMPLAIIGNEYDKAWDDVSREYEERAAAKKELADSKQEAEAILAAGHSGGGEDIASVLPMSQPSNASASVAKHGVDSNTLLEEERDRLTKQQLQDDVVQAEQRARADAERQAEELKAEKQLIQADPAVTAHKKLLEAATLLQNSFRLGKVSTRVIPPNSSTKENSDNGTTISDQIEGQIDSTALDLVASAEVAAPRHITPPMLLQLCEIRSWLPALQYTMRSELDYLNRHSTQKLVASRMLGSAAAAAASGAGAVGTRTSPWGTGRSGSGSGSGSGAQLGRSGSGPGAAGGDGVVVGAGAGRGRRRLSVIGGGRARPDPPMITQPVSVEAAADAYSQTPVDRDRKRVLGEGTVAETRQRNRKHRFKNALSSIDDDDSDADNDGSGSSSSSSSGNSSEVEGNNMGADGHQRKKSKHDADDVDKSVLAARNAFKSRKTLYSRMIKVINPEGLEKLGKLNKSETFYRRMDKVSRDPNSLRSRIWILLELPNSSKEARLLQLMLILLISISIFSLFTQTVVSLSTYGESTTICGQVLQQYCSDKDDFLLDPGCFVMGSNSYGMLLNGTASSKESDHTKLGYDCLNNKCFGEGFNFGSGNSELTCETKNNDDDDAADDNDDSEYYPPFQSKDQLERNYGPPYLFTSREQMMKINPICSRIECKDNTKQYRNVNLLWIVTEFVINIIFTAELALRVIVADSVKGFVQDWMNIFDLLSIVPFYVDLLNAVASTGFSNLDFSILASSPGPIVLVTMRSLKVFRMFKLTRHFTASKILTETAKKIWKQILGMLAFLVFLVILFAILLFEVEAGKECFVGDSNCDVPPAQLATLRIGDRVLLNKDGDVTQFGNVFYGLWFSFVTLTSTGYGDIVPVTNAGQVMSIILMLAGTFYLAMPLTAAASTFYMVHEKHKDKINSQNSSVCPEKDGSAAASSNGGHGTDGGTATQSGSGDDAGVRRGSGTLIGVRDGGDGDGGGGGARGGAGGGAEGGAGRGGRGGHQPDYSGTRRSQHLVLDKKLYKRLKKNVQELFLLQSTISGLFEDLQQPSTRAMPAPILGGERGGAGGGILATSIDDEKMALMERVSLMVVKNRRRREPTDESISGGSRGGGRRGDAEHTSSNEDVSEEEKRSSSDHSDVDVINGTPNRDHGLRGGSADLAAATVPAAVQVYTAISHQVDRLQALLLSIEHDLIRLVILHHRTRKNY